MIYLDNAATTKISVVACNEMQNILSSNWANPSSIYDIGIGARKEIESCQNYMAKYFACRPERIVYTSGATESINTVLKGFWGAYPRAGRHMVTCLTEHLAVIETCKHLEKNNVEVTYLPVDANGEISYDELMNSIKEETSLLSFLHVNNETGTILNTEKLINFRDKNFPDIKIHLDCVQSFGKIPGEIFKSGIDYISVSSHKIHGPKGIGLLYLGEKSKIIPLIHGGGQQNGLRSGTMDAAMIKGFCVATKEAFDEIDSNFIKVKTLKSTLIDILDCSGIDYICNSPENASPYIINLSFPGIRSEVLIHMLESSKIYISQSSACTSKKNNGSHVLKAMKVKPENLNGAVRISFCPQNTIDEIEITCKKLIDSIKQLK